MKGRGCGARLRGPKAQLTHPTRRLAGKKKKKTRAKKKEKTGALCPAENSEVSGSLRSELESLCVDVGQASQDFERVTDSAIDRLERRLESFRDSLAETFKQGATEMRDGMLLGGMMGNIIGGLVGGAIKNTLDRRATDPDWIRARRIYNSIKIIVDSFKAGGRNNRRATLKLLRIHDFTSEQAEYFWTC